MSRMWVLVGLLVFHAPLWAAQDDWMHQAAQLWGRFEAVGVSEKPQNLKQVEYFTLLDDVSRFGNVASDSPTVSRQRKLFSLLMQGRIQEQIGNMTAAKRTEDEYARLKKALPEKERLVFETFFERRATQASHSAARRFEVQAKGKDVSVRAEAYPIRELLTRMCEAAGEKVMIPPEVIGSTDYPYPPEDYRRIDRSLGFVRGRGLHPRGKIGEGFDFIVLDPMYDASLGERADGRAKHEVNPTTPEEGVTAGYVIAFGHYLSPPYVAEIRTTEKEYELYINNVRMTHRPIPVAREEPPSQIPLPASGQFDNFTDLEAYVMRFFADTSAFHGLEEAQKRTSAFMASQKIVKSHHFGGETLLFYFPHNDRKCALLLNTAQPSVPPDEVDAWRIAELARVEERKRQKIQSMERERASIIQCLEGNGLVIFYSRGAYTVVPAESGAQGRLLSLCQAAETCVRQKEMLCDLFDLYGDDSRGQGRFAWDLIFNLRYRELLRRLESENR